MIKREEGPDQARSWAIAFAACIINSVLSGISRTTGLFYVALIEKYGASRLEANLPFTLRNLLRNLGAMLHILIGMLRLSAEYRMDRSRRAILNVMHDLSGLGLKRGQTCFLLGGRIRDLGCLHIALERSYSHDKYPKSGATHMDNAVSEWHWLPRYFNSRKSHILEETVQCFGIALSGACIGAFLFPILIEYLLINVGLSGTFLLSGGIIMHALPASLMIKEPPWIKRNIKQQEEPAIPNKTSCTKESSGTYKAKISEDQFFQTCNMDKFNKESTSDNPSYDGSKIDLNERTVTEKVDTTNSLQIRTLSISDVSVSIAVPPDNQQEASIYKGVIKMISNPMFHMISLSLAAFEMFFDPSITVIVDYLNDKGLEEDVAKYFISMLSLSDLIGRLCFGWVTDRNYLSLPKFMMLIQVLPGICFLLIPIFYSFDALMTLILIYGMAAGANLVMFPILVGKYLTSVQSLAIGCISFLSGMLIFGTPPLIGYFRDNLGSYDGLFYVTGGISVVVGLMWLLEPLFLKINFRLRKPGHSVSVVITP
ncbi:monocarboxylate transporter 5-like [Stegodyphus dumicola]|uniref:monocarboxylate transporter 5-like n=1 Tax=Stegodyphus dumicola TaxID=202533 RepID=UPI0015A7EB57|nr:monocarboxylate transporter 5-like [Stegodyphus dumicola]